MPLSTFPRQIPEAIVQKVSQVSIPLLHNAPIETKKQVNKRN